MSSQNLTVANGFPIKPPPDRTGGTPDLNEQLTYYFNVGRGLAGDLSEAFGVLYGTYTAFNGKAPQAAMDEALRVLGVEPVDYYIYVTSADHG
jgi:hypothetical protein